MKRSELNDVLADAEAFITSFGALLPPFAFWGPSQFKNADTTQIRERKLGWDITDYGLGKFHEIGLILFTTRNGLASELNSGRGMLYAEKMMISDDKQLAPMHRHNVKTEDIINRGGGDLVLELFPAHADGSINRDAGLDVISDAVPVRLGKGELLRLKPGQSVTLPPSIWHAFWAENGRCLITEVSTVNDDVTDNVFEDPIGRFPDIEEDVDPTRLLVTDY
ncbi:MAG: D-lyxose/D-mannose family sugar isomerase [Paracoccaceae bacterium]